MRAERVMFNDVLVEIDKQKKVVWVWNANKHLDPDIDIIGPVHTRQEWCHANTLEEMANGNILLTSRALDSIIVVDKKTREIVFRWGNMSHYDKESRELTMTGGPDTLSGPHDAREIPRGLPGAGHFTCYDNGVVERGVLLAF